MRTIRRLGRSDSGQSIVEVALFLPVFMLLLVGAIDLGRLSQFDTALASGARAGAQYGSLNLITADDSAGMTTAADNDMSNLSLTGSSVSVVPSNFCKCADGTTASCTATACSANHRLLYVSVRVTGTFKPLFRFFTSSATARTRTATLEVGQ
jgi:Flp pilus assembly protein TadG